MSNRKLQPREGFPYTRGEFVMWLKAQDPDRRYEHSSMNWCLLAEAIRHRTRRVWGRMPEVFVGLSDFHVGRKGKVHPLPDWLPYGPCADIRGGGYLYGIYPLTPRRVLEVMGEKEIEHAETA